MLRDYQAKAVASVRRLYKEGRRKILVVAPTGSGKTVIASAFVEGALARGNTVAWITHRRELVQQAPKGCQVVTVQSVLNSAPPPATICIVDEAHHYVAAQWKKIMGGYDTVIGLTATPTRGDGAPMKEVFEALVSAASYPELVLGGYLVDADVVAPGKFLKDKLAQEPVKAWEEYAKGRQGIAFFNSVDEAEAFARDVPNAAAITIRTPPRSRDSFVVAYRSGLLQVLSCVYTLTEGFDHPAASVCMLACQCGHVSGYLQRVGRVLRPSNGKERALVLDLAGNMHKHGFPTDDREYTLEGDGFLPPKKKKKPWQCKHCGFYYRISVSPCPNCGKVLPPQETEVAPQALNKYGNLRSVMSPEGKETFLRNLVRQQTEKGYHEAWIKHKYRAVTGCWVDDREIGRVRREIQDLQAGKVV